MRALITLFCILFSLTVNAIDDHSARKVLKVGVSNLNHFPLFDFNRNEDKGFGYMVLESFANKNGYQFEYIAMNPVKLQNAMEKGDIDFIFPDNPLWRAYRYTRDPNIFSLPFVNAISATFVTTDHTDVGLSQLESVAIPYGYSAVTWYESFENYPIEAQTTISLEASVQRLYRGTVMAADIEYNIAQHLTSIMPSPVKIVVNENLPKVPVQFHLSTIKHILVIERFSHFIKNHKELIELLRKEYGIKVYGEVFDEDGNQALERWLP